MEKASNLFINYKMMIFSLFMPRPLQIEYPNAWYHVMNRDIVRKITRCDTMRLKKNECFFDKLKGAERY